MMKIDTAQVQQVSWADDPDTYDHRLFKLGQGLDEFFVVNPSYDPWILNYIDLEGEDNPGCTVWAIDNLWLVKKFRRDWNPNTGYKFLHCDLDIDTVIEYNADVRYVNQQLKNIVSSYKISIEDLHSEHVWYTEEQVWVARSRAAGVDITGTKNMGLLLPQLEYNPDLPNLHWNILTPEYYHYDYCYEQTWYLDPKFNPTQDKIWLARFTPDVSEGVKDMGYIKPKLEYNPDVDLVDYDSDFAAVYHDLIYDHVWYLDPRFNPLSDDVWVARITNPNSQGVKNMGYVMPKLEVNPAIPPVEFDLPDVAYYEFNNNLVWYLDPRFNPTADDVWAVRITSRSAAAGDKNMGTVSPVFVMNPDIPRELEYYVDDHVPYFDLGYEHVWMLDDSLHQDNERIWAAKIVPRGTSLGVKVVGNIGVKMGNFDVVFISYFEPNAEANWQKLLEVCPTAKRVRNVKGIFEAHKQAAELATTDMFYVVDGDAEIMDNWQFDYRPTVFNLDVVHLWTSLNPINGLEYGYGGVKLFPRKLLLDATTWKVDLTTGLGKLLYIPKVSNITAFNTDPFNTWRSAFRECAKLASSLHLNAYNTAETEDRLRIWTTVGHDKKYGEYALHGANLGKQYGLDNFDRPDELKLINNFEWMKNEFDKFFKQ